MDIRILAGIFLGWSLGANDSANVFGTAVASRMIKYRTAVILLSIFVVIGSILQGKNGLETLSGITTQSVNTAFLVSISSALTVFILTFLNLPASTSHAVVGGIIGIGILKKEINFHLLTKVFVSWITTPVGAILMSIIFYFIFSKPMRTLNLHFFIYDRVMRILLLFAGIYGSYSLGANNVANVTGVFYKAGILDSFNALLIGGVSIAFGALTYSKKVMMTIGTKIVPMDAFSAFIAVLSSAVIVHIFAEVGVPVSTTHAIVSSVIGVGIFKNARLINKTTVIKIFTGWLLTPLISMLFSLIFSLFIV